MIYHVISYTGITFFGNISYSEYIISQAFSKVIPTSSTVGALSSVDPFSFFLQINSKSHHGGIRTLADPHYE